MEYTIKIFLKVIVNIIICLSIVSCKDSFLDVPPKGALSASLLNTEKGIQDLLIGAYSALNGQGIYGTNWNTGVENWLYGSVVGGEAHKGSHPGDQSYMDRIENFNADPSMAAFNEKWIVNYEGISRCNNILKILPTVQGISDQTSRNIQGQTLFLRAHYYFELKKMFNRVPWIDENTSDFNVANDIDIWPNITKDFEDSVDLLPEVQKEVGRANKWAAASYLAKCYMFQGEYEKANALFDEIIENGNTSLGISYSLFPRFNYNFLPNLELSSPEAVFSIQYTVNAGNGTPLHSGGGIRLNYPLKGPTNCCGFFQPSQDLVNSFRTNGEGLPYLDDYNEYEVKNDMGLTPTDPFTTDTGNLDPRLDWTVGRRGIPYLDWGVHSGSDWVRDQSTGGPYSPIKHVFWKINFDEHSNHTAWGTGTAVNYVLIRFSDVLLMAAEAKVNLGGVENLNKAEELVNLVRKRAANPDGFVYRYINDDSPEDGFSDTPAANYKVSPYPQGTFNSLGGEYALKAIYLERKLELAMEGHRFFDLVRWDIAETTLNSYWAYENQIVRNDIKGTFVSPKNNYYPIPLDQIDLSIRDGSAVLIQNQGY